MHNPITRLAADIVTGGAAELYYAPRDAYTFVREVRNGNGVRAAGYAVVGEYVSDATGDALDDFMDRFR